MITKFYARNEINFGDARIPAGELVATLDVAKGLPFSNAINGIVSGLLTPNPPPDQPPAPTAAGSGDAQMIAGGDATPAK